MKRNLFIACWIILLHFIPISGTAQVKEFGEISPEEFTAKYPGVEAEILFDYAQTYFTYPEGEIKQMYRRHLRILINNEDGFDWGDINIPYYVETDRRSFVIRQRANTYHLTNEGKIKKYSINKKDVFTNKVDEHYQYKSFAMPQLKAGAIIEVTYLIESDFFWNVRDWIFQDKVPVHWSEYRVKAPPLFKFIISKENTHDLFIEDKKEDAIQQSFAGATFRDTYFRWVMKDLAAWENETLITTLSDYVPQVKFQISSFTIPGHGPVNILKGWDMFCKELLAQNYLGGYLKTGKAVKAFIGNLTPQVAGKTPEEKIRIIRKAVAEGFTFSGNRTIHPMHSQKDLLKLKQGNSADINLLLIALLRHFEIPAKPAILSTTDHGLVNTQYPFIDNYNYLLAYCQAGEKDYLIDGVFPQQKFDLLPTFCLTDKALILDEENPQWIQIPHHPISKKSQTNTLVITPENNIEGRIVWSYNHHQAYDLRQDIERRGLEAIKTSIREGSANLDINTIEFNNLEDPEATVKVKAAYTKECQEEAYIYLPPFPLHQFIDTKAFQEEKRHHPIHWDYLLQDQYTTRIINKSDFEIIEYPKSVRIIFPDESVRFTLTSDMKDNALIVKYTMEINKLNFGKEAFPSFKQIFDLMAEKGNEYIVLKRKKP